MNYESVLNEQENTLYIHSKRQKLYRIPTVLPPLPVCDAAHIQPYTINLIPSVARKKCTIRANKNMKREKEKNRKENKHPAIRYIRRPTLKLQQKGHALSYPHDSLGKIVHNGLQ
jgi:hypothetical protein